MARGYQQPTKLAPPGLWLLATELLGQPVRVDDPPYPHVCGTALPAPKGVRPPRIQRRECVACAEQVADR